MRTTICANKIKLKILSYKDDIDFDKELTPYLTKQELFILRYYLNSKIPDSQKEMNEKGNFSTTINYIVAKIISKIKQTIKLKEKRNLICMQHRGEKTVKHFSQYLDERCRVELAEKMSTKREDVIIKLNTTPAGLYEMNKLNNNKFENLLAFEDIKQIYCGQYSK